MCTGRRLASMVPKRGLRTPALFLSPWPYNWWTQSLCSRLNSTSFELSATQKCRLVWRFHEFHSSASGPSQNQNMLYTTHSNRVSGVEGTRRHKFLYVRSICLKFIVSRLSPSGALESPSVVIDHAGIGKPTKLQCMGQCMLCAPVERMGYCNPHNVKSKFWGNSVIYSLADWSEEFVTHL